MLQDSRGEPLMVTAQYRYSSTPGWTAMTGCRKKLGNPGGLLKQQEGTDREKLGGCWREEVPSKRMVWDIPADEMTTTSNR
uniref:Uncharacterized protein n=1 Tax=Oryza sativa subsp. japonica TaxID=39947 RepID=Q6YWB5_ORYSJ|nr:hypothetical protein [Oryza sativa Japonica Group]BAD17571.1 hypothetical protein [Oryza sativa Japonica Group]